MAESELESHSSEQDQRMAEETETSSGSGLLSSLLGSLSLWSPGGAEAAQQLPETSQETSPESESQQQESPESAPQQQESMAVRQEVTSQSSEAPSPTVAVGKPSQTSSSEDSDNPLSIFGLATPTQRPKDGTKDGEAAKEQEKPAKGKRRGKKGRQGRGNPAESRPTAKKPPMRTARDVINRIQWDRNLPEDYFDIGYLDR